MTRILGLDVGERRIGVALSDALGITAQRLAVIERQGAVRDAQVLESLTDEHEVGAVVVGLPLTMQGSLGEQAKRVMEFVETLRRSLRCPIHVMDERLTTVQGERVLIELGTSRRKRKRLADQVAAQLILQAYLDAQHKR